MKIAPHTIVTVAFSIFDAQGTLIEQSPGPVRYLHGGEDGFLPRIEEALLGKEPGHATVLHLEPEDAFGEYDAELVRVEPKGKFPQPLEVGMQFEGVPDDPDSGDEDARIYTVTDIAGDRVVLDGNHPYAGMALKFEVKVIAVRAATEDEVDQGFAEQEEDDDDEDDEGDAPEASPRIVH
jgi:FKBP-type peptidyl-prolyl cis-trans isomerase SlyD